MRLPSWGKLAFGELEFFQFQTAFGFLIGESTRLTTNHRFLAPIVCFPAGGRLRLAWLIEFPTRVVTPRDRGSLAISIGAGPQAAGAWLPEPPAGADCVWLFLIGQALATPRPGPIPPTQRGQTAFELFLCLPAGADCVWLLIGYWGQFAPARRGQMLWLK